MMVRMASDVETILARASREVIHALRRLQTSRPGPLVAALDGGSGAGKSTLAERIANQIDAAWVPLDDFFSADIPEARWDSFSDAEKLVHVFDWARVRENALLPLRSGRAARWYAFDFAAGQRPDGTYGMQAQAVERQPAPFILLDGAYSAGPALADLVDLAVLVDVAVGERHSRLATREQAHFLENWHARWDGLETYYFTQVRPASSFDLVLKVPDSCS